MSVIHKAVASTSAEVLRFLIQKNKHEIDIGDKVSLNMNLMPPKSCASGWKVSIQHGSGAQFFLVEKVL